MHGSLSAAYRLIYTGLTTIIIGVLLFLLATVYPNMCLWWCTSNDEIVQLPVTDIQVIPTLAQQAIQTVPEIPTERPRSLVRFNGNCQGNNRIIGVQVSASSFAPQSKDDGGNPTFYFPSHTLDCRSDTSWRTTYRYDSPWLRYSFDVPVVLTHVGLKPGYDKLDPFTGKDRWFQNWRVRSVEFDTLLVNGSHCISYWQDIPDIASMQLYNLNDCVGNQEVREITMIIRDAYPPQDNDPREFVAISDMMFEGFVYDQ